MLKAKRLVDAALARVVIVLMAAAVLNVLWQVGTRFGSRFVPGLEPSGFTDELARFLLIWVGLLGAAYAAGKKMHLAIDLLPEALSGTRGEHVLAIVVKAFVLLFAAGVMGIGGGQLVWLQLLLGQTSAALGIPLGYVYLVVPLAGALIAFYAALYIADSARQLRGLPPVLEK